MNVIFSYSRMATQTFKLEFSMLQSLNAQCDWYEMISEELRRFEWKLYSEFQCLHARPSTKSSLD
jgi:hypothetical protein